MAEGGVAGGGARSSRRDGHAWGAWRPAGAIGDPGVRVVLLRRLVRGCGVLVPDGYCGGRGGRVRVGAGGEGGRLLVALLPGGRE